MRTLNKKLLALLFTLSMSSTLVADCTYQLFNLSSQSGTRISEFVDQISNECGYTVIVKDNRANKILKKRLNKTHLKDLIITEVFDIILRENNLDYSLKNNILKIAYITTKTYSLDYIITKRIGESSTNVTLESTSSQGNAETLTSGTSTAQSSKGESQSGLNISTKDTFELWDNIKTEVFGILNRPEDKFEAKEPVLNKEAGLITISATYNQIKRLDVYLERMHKKLKNQVLIDVQLFSVSLNDSRATGIDWSQIYALQNLKITQDHLLTSNVDTVTSGVITTLDTTAGPAYARAINLTGSTTITDFVKFLKEQGDVRSISNPKILTLNNQPALISVGNQFFYKITNSSSQASTGGSTITQNDIIDSVFAGILLDITPEISENAKTVTLKINPSISETIDTISSDSSTRTLLPDLSRKQLSSVVTAQDGERIVLGGLIGTTSSNKVTKIPLLGDIPLLGTLFSSSRYEKLTTELVIVITPHIVKANQKMSLKKLGFRGILDSEVNEGTFIPTFEHNMLKEESVAPKKDDK